MDPETRPSAPTETPCDPAPALYPAPRRRSRVAAALGVSLVGAASLSTAVFQTITGASTSVGIPEFHRGPDLPLSWGEAASGPVAAPAPAGPGAGITPTVADLALQAQEHPLQPLSPVVAPSAKGRTGAVAPLAAAPLTGAPAGAGTPSAGTPSAPAPGGTSPSGGATAAPPAGPSTPPPSESAPPPTTPSTEAPSSSTAEPTTPAPTSPDVTTPASQDGAGPSAPAGSPSAPEAG